MNVKEWWEEEKLGEVATIFVILLNAKYIVFMNIFDIKYEIITSHNFSLS